MNNKVLLMILDGWGEGRQDESNVIYTQGAPYIEALRKQYPMSTLKACGEYDANIMKRLLGVQGNLWAECIVKDSHYEYMLYPRAFAIAEIGWTPQEKREFFHFRERSLILITVFREKGYNTFDLFNESLRAQTGRLRFDDPTFKLL